MFRYIPKGVCSKEINFDIVDNKVVNVSFKKGCPGNTLGLAKLIDGMEVSEAIKRLKGIKCGTKSTSCPDQLALALESTIKDLS